MKQLVFLLILAAICYFGWGYLSEKYAEMEAAKKQIYKTATDRNNATQADTDAALSR